ncbi:hypothetical protein FNAPI_2982 [Fusarium napiforme]|uniref:3CxxC-type domain-containing protein n=1 Tax=Fusarium napiforme TaxID=42672 RepID=A0A8H5JVZ0_9HYPO|nr:hypothetical protein FNAPI_2982 [Fusarium napiforme]
MANEVTTDALKKIAAMYSGLLEWVKQPVDQTSNARANIKVSAIMYEEEPKSSMYPELHGLIAEYLEEDGLSYTFRQDYQKINIKRVFDSKVVGKFECSRLGCTNRSWESNSIAIRIREYEGNQYNVKVYHQQCKRCNRYTRPEIEILSYVDRVSFRIKKWNGIDAKPIPIDVVHKRDHMERLCEGCKKGHCSKKK